VARILLIDDDGDFAERLREELRGGGHEVTWCEAAEGGLALLTSGEPFDLVLLDNRMPGMSGIEFLAELRRRGERVPVILMTNFATPESAIQSRKLGARVYFIKPLDWGELLASLEARVTEMLRTSRLMKERVVLPTDGAPPPDSATALLGNSPEMQKVYERVGQVAESNASVLILGETGTGKELIARAIFQYSRRSDRPFIAFNSAALAEQLVESQLFGHEKGAFTSSVARHIGKFEQADGGTILLDEIGDMSLGTQAKILRVLQEGELVRLGGTEVIKVDVRVVACTHYDLEAAIRRKEFRDDLYYRLNTITLRLPALRERGEDLVLLAGHFLAREAALGRPGLTFHSGALEKLRRYRWPGNVRQLQGAIKQAALICDGVQVRPEDLESVPDAATADEGDPLAALRRLIEWAWKSDRADLAPWLQQQLESELLRFGLTQGMSEVKLAGRLGMARNTLRARVKQYGLRPSEADRDMPGR
jgi:DNA-binding NtrC family response regulator